MVNASVLSILQCICMSVEEKTGKGVLTHKRGVNNLCNETLERIRNLRS